jgi:D-alanine-D-alanine ligase-like ATP-grasp enzyme
MSQARQRTQSIMHEFLRSSGFFNNVPSKGKKNPKGINRIFNTGENAQFLGFMILLAARKGYAFTMRKPTAKSLELQIHKGSKTAVFSSVFRNVPEAHFHAQQITEYKWVTNYICKLTQLPVPDHLQIHHRAAILDGIEFAKKIGFPVVIKPCSGSDGNDVYPNIQTPSQLKKKMNEIWQRWQHAGGISVEKHIDGNNYRLVVLGSRVILAYGGFPPIVTGDGKRTISKLISAENQRRKTTRAYENFAEKQIVVDGELLNTLTNAKLRLDSVLPKGEQLQIRYNLNRGKGARIQRIASTDIHKSVIKTAVQTIRLCGLHHGALDIVAPNISEPLSKTGGKIVEVQAHPALDQNLIDVKKTYEEMFEYCLANDTRNLPAKISVHDLIRT